MSSDCKRSEDLAIIIADIFRDVFREIGRARELARQAKFHRAVSEPGISDAESVSVLVEEGREVQGAALDLIADALGLSHQIGSVAIRSNDLGQLLFQAATNTVDVQKTTELGNALDDELVQVAATAVAFAARRRLERIEYARTH